MAEPTAPPKTNPRDTTPDDAVPRGRELRLALLRQLSRLPHPKASNETLFDLDEEFRGAGELDADALLTPLETLADEHKR